jgi:hypothetical protein
MAGHSRDTLRQWAKNYVELWNAGDREAWVRNWRSVAPGDFSMLDPVGTPAKHGFEDCALKSFDLFQPNVRFRIQPGTLFICDNEVAWLLENHFVENGENRMAFSIETYRFEPDGSVVIRTFYNVPAHSAGDLGKLFQTYLP